MCIFKNIAIDIKMFKYVIHT